MLPMSAKDNRQTGRATPSPLEFLSVRIIVLGPVCCRLDNWGFLFPADRDLSSLCVKSSVFVNNV